jgi:Cu(I)/Ag(I) efflux system membrane fusion protein
MNKTSLVAVGVVIVAAAAAGGYALYAAGMNQGMGMSGAPTATPTGGSPPANETPEDATRRHIAQGLKAGDVDPATGQRILYYHDPMVPGNKFDKPAKSPFMDMMLYPAYAGGDGDSSRITVSPRVQQNLGLRTAEVVEGTLTPQVAAVGSIAFNEREQVVVQARAAGCMFAQRSMRWPRASRWPSCTCPTGWRHRRSTCRCGACRAASSRRWSTRRASACVRPA